VEDDHFLVMGLSRSCVSIVTTVTEGPLVGAEAGDFVHAKVGNSRMSKVASQACRISVRTSIWIYLH
jgi:hypothetical protein